MSTVRIEERLNLLIGRIDDLAATDDYQVNWTGGVTDDAIADVEKRLDVRLPESYKAFARLVGGEGIEIFPISSIATGDNAPGTLVDHTLHYREPWVRHPLPKHLVVIQRDFDDNEPLCLDTSTWTAGECPVVLYYLDSGTCDPIAVDFLTFYEVYMQPNFDN